MTLNSKEQAVPDIPTAQNLGGKSGVKEHVGAKDDWAPSEPCLEMHTRDLRVAPPRRLGMTRDTKGTRKMSSPTPANMAGLLNRWIRGSRN